MARRRLLVQLLALAAATSLLLAASRVHPTATPRSSSGVPRAAVFRGARRLAPLDHLRLSEAPSEAPAATSSDPDAPAPAPAPAPTSAAAADHTLAIMVIIFFAPILVVLAFAAGSVLLVLLFAILHKGVASLASSVADLYAAAKTAREKATRVRPLDQDDGVEAPAGP